MSPVMSWADRRKIAAEAPSFTPLEQGTYSFIIKEAAEVTEKDGWPRFKINPSVEAGPRANARIFHTFYTTEKPAGMRMFYEQMEILGVSADFIDSVTNDQQIGQALVGKRFTAEVFHEDYNGKLQQRLRKIAPPVGSPSAGPGAATAAAGGFAAAPPVQQFAPMQQAVQQPVQQFAPVQQAVQQPVQQFAPVQQAVAPVESPWGNTIAAPPAPPFA